MARVKRGVARHKRHKKMIDQASGYFGRKKNVYSRAHEQVMKSGQYAVRDRRAKKREFRRLWIARISAGCQAAGLKYNEFIDGLIKQGVEVNRKMLSELAIHEPTVFAELAKTAVAARAAAHPA